jgi:hypothetical protein
MNDVEKKAVLEDALNGCDLTGGSYGEAGYIEGAASASDIANELWPALKEAGYDLVKAGS